jgi:hypothetical protein
MEHAVARGRREPRCRRVQQRRGRRLVEATDTCSRSIESTSADA